MWMLALDLGAESGRAVLGRFDGERLTIEEIHRFPNVPVQVRDTLYWDVLRLFADVKEALRRAAQVVEGDLASVGVDAWGVDFALLDAQGRLLGNPVHYRDRRTEGVMAEVFRCIPPEEIYRRTGIQFMPINTLYQLYALARRQDPQLQIASTFLTIPDLFHSWLSGVHACEFTNATTTQCYDPEEGDWARDLLGRLGIPSQIFPKVVPPGTVLGLLEPELKEALGLPRTQVIAPASHDTGSAVAAVPFHSPQGAYISSGTWSLVGVEVRTRIITSEAMKYNFTHEGGVNGTYRFLKNVMGLWLLQETRRTWAAQGQRWDYESLLRLAESAPPLQSLIDPDDPRFLAPGDIPARIRSFCAETGQPVPGSQAEVVRCILESLVLKYRWVIERLESLLGWHIQVIHVVGGGSRNQLMCQWTADATGRLVLAGPVEATAIGNILLQCIALGGISGLDDARAIVRSSFSPIVYEPQPVDDWEEAYLRFLDLINNPAPDWGSGC
jgi:rhamnulokinase